MDKPFLLNCHHRIHRIYFYNEQLLVYKDPLKNRLDTLGSMLQVL